MLQITSLNIPLSSDQLTPWDAEMWKVTPHGCLLRAGHISIPSLSSSGHMSQVTQELRYQVTIHSQLPPPGHGVLILDPLIHLFQ